MIPENDLAVAFRNRYPVSPGHTLVNTKWQVQEIKLSAVLDST